MDPILAAFRAELRKLGAPSGRVMKAFTMEELSALSKAQRRAKLKTGLVSGAMGAALGYAAGRRKSKEG